jgi:mRNA (2'-O-methyladenosine-N6-)-methyltransferase
MPPNLGISPETICAMADPSGGEDAPPAPASCAAESLLLLEGAAAFDPARAPPTDVLACIAAYRAAIRSLEAALAGSGAAKGDGPSETGAAGEASSPSLPPPQEQPAAAAAAGADAAAAATAAATSDAEWRVPPHCVPIHANVTTFDWAALAAAAQFDAIMMDPPWQLATSNPTRGVALGYAQLSDASIAALPAPALQAGGGLLFVWVINAKYKFVLDLFDVWGYE